MKEETVFAVIRSRGVFQINPLAYRNQKTAKLLKQMTKKGLLCKQRVSASCVNYFIQDKEPQ